MKTILATAAVLAFLAPSAEAAKLASIKRAWRAVDIDQTVNPHIKLKGAARTQYRQLHRNDMGEGTLVMGMKNPSGRKTTVAATTFAIFTRAGVGEHLRIFRKSDQQLRASGDAVDGPFRWTK